MECMANAINGEANPPWMADLTGYGRQDAGEQQM